MIRESKPFKESEYLKNIEVGNITRMVAWLKQLDSDFGFLDVIYNKEGICPTPELYREGEDCVCMYWMSCSLGDPKPRREAHEHVKKALDRFRAWM